MVSCWTSVLRASVLFPSVFHFRMITWANINGFSPNLVCAVILRRCGLGLLMGKFHQIVTELSVRDTPIFLYPDDTLSKCQGILNKHGTCIDMKEILFGIANGQISSMIDSVTIMAGCYTLMFLFTSENTVSFHCVQIPFLFISDIQWFHCLH